MAKNKSTKSVRTTMNNGRSRELLLLLLLFVFSIGLYLPSLANGFAFDDRIHIEHNYQLIGWTPLINAALSPIYPGDLFRPTTVLINGIIRNVFGESAFPHHLVNIILHGVTSILVTFGMWRMNGTLINCETSSRTILFGLCVGAVWAVMPIHLEVVANISGRAELLAAFFGIAALHLLANNYADKGYYLSIRCLLVFLSLALSFGAKESGILYGIVACIFARSLTYRFTTVVAVTTVMAMRYLAFNHAIPELTPNSLDNPIASLAALERIPIALSLLGRYAVACFYPLSIGADYSWGFFYPPLQWSVLSPYLFVSSTLVMAMVALAIYLTCQRAVFKIDISPNALFTFYGLAWFFFFFSLTSNIAFPIGTIFGERLAYSPSIGIVVAVCGLFRAVSTYTKSIRSGLLLAASLCYCLLLSPVVISASHYWRDNRSLFSRQMEVSPQSVKSKVNYAVILKNEGKYSDAKELIKSALLSFPHYSEAHYNLGHIALLEGNFTDGKRELERALELNQTLPDAINLLGRSLLNEKNYSAAGALFDRLLQVDPSSIEGHIGKCAVSLAVGDLITARQLLEKLAAIAPLNKEVESLQSIYTSLR